MSVDVKGTTTGRGGTAYGWFAGAASNSYYLSVTLENADGQNTAASIIIPKAASSIIEIANQGAGIGIGADAPENGINIGIYNRGNAIEVDTENYETTFTGNLELLVDCINKPAISIGWSGSGPAHVLTSSDEIFTADTTFGQSGNSTSTAHTRVTRAGNYAFVLVPAGTGTVPIELSAQARVDSIGQTNFAMGIYIERTLGSADISDLPDSIGSPIMTFAGQGGFIGNWITPRILNLPRSASGQNIYRFSLRGRTTNATGQVGSWCMTVKLL